MEYRLLSADHPIRESVRECARILVIGDRLGVTGNQKEKKKIFHINGTDYDYDYRDEP